MHLLIIIIGGLTLLFTLKSLRNITHYIIFLNKELPIVWVLIWFVIGFLVMFASTLYKTDFLGLQIALVGSIFFFISSLDKKMPTIKAEDETIVKRRFQELGYVDYSIPHAKIYYKVGIIGFAVIAIITWIILYATFTA